MAGLGSSQALERAFQRHSRPQLPTLPNAGQDSSTEARRSRLLNVHSNPSWLSKPPISQERTVDRRATKLRGEVTAQWVDYIQLGTLAQGRSEFIVCTGRENRALLLMFKRTDAYDKRCFSFSHPNLHVPRLLISTAADAYLGFDYARYTLEELLNVHVPFEEAHLHAIAYHIFEAIKYLNSEELFHGRISADTIRVCGRSGRIFLSDWETSLENKERHALAEMAIRDLESLGLTMLDCMELPSKREPRSAKQVRDLLAQNKVFGLSEPERWSGSEQLVDFVDDLFSTRRKTLLKFQKPHEYVCAPIPCTEILVPFTELVSFECFAIWRAV